MTNSINDTKTYTTLHQLAHLHAEQFVEFIEGDPRISDIIHELAADYVTENLPVISEEYQTDLALSLLQQVYIAASN